MGNYNDILDYFDNRDLEPTIVVITNSGKYYPTYVEMMVKLGLTGAKEFIEKFGDDWHSHSVGWENKSQVEFLIENGINTCVPRNNELYYKVEKTLTHPEFYSEQIYRLIRISDGREIIIGEKGFKEKI